MTEMITLPLAHACWINILIYTYDMIITNFQETLTSDVEKSINYCFHSCSYDDLYEIVVGLRIIAEYVIEVR